MSIDIGPMLATISQVSLSAGTQMATPSEEFAVLMNVGAPPPKTGYAVENPNTIEGRETPKAVNLEEIAKTINAETNPAVNQADALVLALSSDARRPGILDNPRKALNGKPTDGELATVPIITPTDKPVSDLPPVRRARVEPPAILRRELALDLPLMPPDSLADQAESQRKADDRQDEANSAEQVARPLVVAPNTHDFATTHVSSAPTPVQDPTFPRDNKAIEAPSGRVRVDRMQEAAPATPLKNVDVQKEIEADTTKSKSVVTRVDAQTHEAQPKSSTVESPVAAIVKQSSDRKPLPETALPIIVASESHLAHRTETKSVSSRMVDVTDTHAVKADIVENSIPVTSIKSFSDVQIAPSSPMAKVDVSTSTVDPLLDRQLDLVRNERWLGELAQDIANTSESKDRLSFRLMPQQLGRLDVEVSRSQSGLSLAFRTESDSAQSILSAAQSRLADELRFQGVRLADTPMFSSDARHYQHNGAGTRLTPLVESFTTPTDVTDAPEKVLRDGRYA